jgi:hypothetical protein
MRERNATGVRRSSEGARMHVTANTNNKEMLPRK